MDKQVINGAIQQWLARLHATPWRGVIAVTGGSAVLGELCGSPGASQTLLEGLVPYSPAALRRFVGGQPDRACSPKTARIMAAAALQRARDLAAADTDSAKLFGLACTASLVSREAKRGEHRIHAAIQTRGRTLTRDLILTKGARSRAAEEHVAAMISLGLLAECSGHALPGPELQGTETLITGSATGPRPWQDVLVGVRAAVCHLSGESPLLHRQRFGLLPGSFDPFHQGHLHMAQYAEKFLALQVEYELCVRNVDKPPLDFHEIHTRTRGICGDRRIWLTATPTFLDKARQFPGATFLVGADTIARIANPRYYDDSMARTLRAIAEIRDLGCDFLVFGRLLRGNFQSMLELDLPKPLIDICQQVPEKDFRIDVDSTSIRTRQRT